MVAFRPFVYVHFSKSDGFVEAPDVASAKQHIRDLFPEAVFSRWQRVGGTDVLVAWADPGRRVRHFLGEESHKAEPDAFVICQAWPLEIAPPSEAELTPLPRGVRA